MVNAGQSFQPPTGFQKTAWATVMGQAWEVPGGPQGDTGTRRPFPAAQPRSSFHSSQQGAVRLAFSSLEALSGSTRERKPGGLRPQLLGIRQKASDA